MQAQAIMAVSAVGVIGWHSVWMRDRREAIDDLINARKRILANSQFETDLIDGDVAEAWNCSYSSDKRSSLCHAEIFVKKADEWEALCDSPEFAPNISSLANTTSLVLVPDCKFFGLVLTSSEVRALSGIPDGTISGGVGGELPSGGRQLEPELVLRRGMLLEIVSREQTGVVRVDF